MSDDKKQLDYKEVFELFDRVGDGKIAAADLGLVLRAYGKTPSQAEVQEMVKDAEAKFGGRVDRNALQGYYTRKFKTTDWPDDLQIAFKVFDRENTSTINLTELRQVLLNLGEKLTDQEIDEVIKDVQTVNDGKIDYENFLKLIM